MAFSPISGNSQSGRFDGRHITAVPRRTAQSLTPNLLRDLSPFIDLDDELDSEELLRRLALDEVELSEEAKDILRKLKKRKKRGQKDDEEAEQSEEEFLELLAQLESQEYTPLSELPQHNVTPFLPPVLTLSHYNPPSEPVRTEPVAPRSPRPSPPPDDDLALLTRAGKIALAMVAIAPERSAALKVARDLEVFGASLLSEVKRFGTRFVVVEPHVAFTDIQLAGMYLFGAGEKTADGRPWSVVRGVYSSKRRMVCVGQELLDESTRSGRSTVRHEFAHAYEDFWSQKRQRRHPLSVELWYRFEGSRRGFVTDYAATQPAEYFAESVEAFFAPSLRDRLRSLDPEMYVYLGELFEVGFSA